MMEVQHQCIPHLLKGKDLLAAAKTGSGKNFSFFNSRCRITCKTEI